MDTTNIVVEGIPVEVILADNGADRRDSVYRWNKTRFVMVGKFSLGGKCYDTCQKYNDPQDYDKALECVRESVRRQMKRVAS